MPKWDPIRIESRTDRWRFVCPRGHRSWEPTNRKFWCGRCSASWPDCDPEFDELLDLKTGERVPRDRVDLGQYERSHA